MSGFYPGRLSVLHINEDVSTENDDSSVETDDYSLEN